MKIFISGASGLVGSNCLKYFKEMGWEVVGSHFSFETNETVFYNTLDLQNKKNFDINTFNPDVILHCGALTHVDYCENNIEESYEKTVISTQNLLSIAKKIDAKLVFISTDYVFDGTKGPYIEEDEKNPLSIYAKHKWNAEQAVKNDKNNHLIIRITNVYGDEIRNKNFVARIVEQCENNQIVNLTLPIDQYATPVNAWDIARALYLLIQDNKKGIYHIASTDFMNRVELALNILKYYPEIKYELTVMQTSEMNQVAKRPLLGGLKKIKFSKEYPTFIFGTIDTYMQNRLKEKHL